MKIPIDWLKNFVDLPLNQNDLTHGLTMAGHMLDKVIYIDGKTVLDLELRGNRADCYSIYGVAREISAIFNKKLKDLPVIKLKIGQPKHVKVLSTCVKRVATIEIRNILITKSPSWLSEKLKASGIDSVNNIVDLTNYVMLETGEPMHAFDLDKVGENLEIRLAKKGETITTFANTVLTLMSEDLVWAKDQNILSVAGAIGEKFHSVSSSTKNILLEAANYDRANIRRTVYRHNLLTEAGIRHEKDIDPSMVELAFGRFLYLLQKNKWGEFQAQIHDYYPRKSPIRKIILNYDYLKNLGGIDIDHKEVKMILTRLGFKIESVLPNNLLVSVPNFRTDIFTEEDVIEEILRIYGYDKIPVNTLSLEIPENVTPPFITQEQVLKNAATSVGFDESISLSFVKESYQKHNLHSENSSYKAVTLVNPPSPDIKNMRLSLFPNLLESAERIINEQGSRVQLFELGKIYYKHDIRYFETREIGFIYWKKGINDFLGFKALINAFFEKSNIEPPKYLSATNNLNFSNSFNLLHKEKAIGYGGVFNDIYFVEIELDKILNINKIYKVSLWPKYPAQVEDYTFVFPKKTRIGNVLETIKSIDYLIETVNLKDTYKDAITFRIYFRHQEKTLDSQEIKRLRTKIFKTVKDKYGGIIKE